MVLSHFDGCLDSGLTGVSEQDCFRIRNEQNFQQVRIDDVKVASSIVDLKGKYMNIQWTTALIQTHSTCFLLPINYNNHVNILYADLRDLQIECRSIWVPCHIITDISGYLAFAGMSQLRSLKITEIGVPEHFDVMQNIS